MSKKKSGIILALIVLFTAILAVMDFAKFPLPNFNANGTKNYNGIANTIGLGIDLKGGYYAVLTPKAAEGYDESEADDLFQSAVDILRTRLDNKGYTEATITIQGIGDEQEIRVEIPEIDDPDEVLKIIGSSGELTFESSTGTIYLSGTDVKSSQAGYDKDGNPVVLLEFTTNGTAKFAEATKVLTGELMYIKLGGETVSSPQVNEQITSSTAEINVSRNVELNAELSVASKLYLEAKNSSKVSLTQNGGNTFISHAGSSYVDFKANVNSLEVEGSGGSESHISGNATLLSATGSGTTRIDAELLDVPEGSALLSGSAKCHVNVSLRR